MLRGTWASPEIYYAVEKGYKIVKIHEVWNYPDRVRGLFKSYIQYCAKVMQTYFSEIRGFSWLFDEKISNFRWKRIFNEKSQ